MDNLLALQFMEKNYGDDIIIIKVEVVNKNVRVVWKEAGDEDKYFSIIGKSKYNKVVELSGGEY